MRRKHVFFQQGESSLACISMPKLVASLVSRVSLTASPFAFSYGYFTWQFIHPEEGSNAETSVVLYRHLASIKYILTLTCKFSYALPTVSNLERLGTSL